ncbi:MAG: hypothetical protein QXU18_08385 [Thermoplasmatales archaeon]
MTVEEFKNEFHFSDEEFDLLFDIGKNAAFDLLPAKEIEEHPIYSEEVSERSISEDEIEAISGFHEREKESRLKEKIYYVDEVKLEQANEQHKRTLGVMVNFLHSRGVKCFWVGRTDLVAKNDKEIWLFEVKSITKENERKQTRMGIGQLFDYEFVELMKYRNTHTVIKALIFEKQPSKEILQWLRFIGIYDFWIVGKDEISGDEDSVKSLNKLFSDCSLTDI